MFKTNNETILIDAKATDPIPTGVVFWSHDRGTAKLIFQLQKDYMNQPLSAGTIVPILLEFNSDTAEGGRGRHIYHAVIEDAINGIVSIVLEDNILGYVGRVTGSIYIELPDSRSLDTAGRFTFDIKRSPIDLNTPELEDYYWQGFNEIIDEYHQTINTIKSEAKALIDSLTADVTTAQSKITQLEQSITTANTNLNARIDEINQKIDDNDVFTKAESSANVIYQVIGKEKAEITFRLDAKSEFVKVSSVGYTTLLSPTNVSWTPLTEEQLNNLSSLDGSLYSARDAAANYMKQLKYDCDILGFFKSLLGEKFFTIRGATTDSQKVEVLESLITDFTSNVYGYGSGGGINKLTHRNWNGTWTFSDSTAANEVTRIGQTIESTDTNWKKLINGGKISVLSNSEPTISPNYSTVNIDYLCLDVTIELSANEHFEYMIAANHRENLATQEEAEAGEDNKKIMTPLRVMQSIKKFVENKFVSIAGNETIGGLKNFRDGLMVNGNNVLTHKGVVTIKYSNADFPTEIASGYITFVRYGDEVQAVFNFKTRIGNDFAKDQSIIWGIAADFQADTSEPQYIGITSTGGTASIVKFTAGGSTLTAHSILLKDTWYAGTVTYLAKNKL
ncbi:BppU family phage baseplate upper protein [Enterococcus avium]|uniref:BppU family phage baseplate upper protein n=1 Tax=Enterococcus avium TaxID=33945 RepID=UPI002891879B|nr:BppU family phage baseplate upper protein [Enterococcus avium]MDT2462833.1 BppU family phage baseplate upper protein [Enterococcus avium]